MTPALQGNNYPILTSRSEIKTNLDYIFDGILLDIFSYVVLNLAARKWDKLNPTIVTLAIIFALRYI